MINSITLDNFRGLKHISLSDLCRVSLISGKNNAGKSSILESIFLFIDHASPESFIKINNFRGMTVTSDPSSMWAPIFYELNTMAPLRMSMQLNNKETKLEYLRDDSFVPTDAGGAPQDIFNQFVSSAKSTYTLKFKFEQGEYVEDGHFVISASGVMRNIKSNRENNQLLLMPFTQFINSTIVSNDNVVAEWFGKLQLEGKKQKVIEILRLIDSSISDVSTIAFQNQIQLYAKLGEKLLPLKLAGDGINKLLFIALAIIANPNSIILIDEIETGFHYSMYAKLWEVVSTVARESNCQIIATTHSYECIDAAVEGVKKANLIDDFCYYRVEHNKDKNLAFRYSGALLSSAVATNMEVR